MAIRKATAVILPSLARTASPADSILEFNTGDLGITVPSMQQVTNLHVIINVTAVTATPSVVPEILTADPASGTLYPLLTGAAITAVTAVPTVLRVGRDMEPAANLAARDIIPENILLRFTHADADSITYSVAVSAEFEMVQ